LTPPVIVRFNRTIQDLTKPLDSPAKPGNDEEKCRGKHSVKQKPLIKYCTLLTIRIDSPIVIVRPACPPQAGPDIQGSQSDNRPGFPG